MARTDPQVNLRMPEEIKLSLETAADTNKRSLTAEIIARLRDSLHQGDKASNADLAPTVARLERDLAKSEVDKSYETLTLYVVAVTLRLLLDKVNDDEQLGGPLANMTVSDWRGLADAYIRRSSIPRADLDLAFERMREAELRVRGMDAINADPIWENMATLRNMVYNKAAHKD